ncbi:MAG: hypothetical protein ACOX7U_01095 [Desulfitobacteriia bacterium]|jgi:putative membrane protein
MKKSFKKPTALLLTAVLLGMLLIQGQAQAYSGETTKAALKPSKEEIIYAKLSGNGSLKQAYIVNSFELNESGRIIDYGFYDQVRNLTTKEQPLIDGEAIEFNVPKGKFYYQGDLKSLDLPWEVVIKYFLDGNPIEASELAGASGRLHIEFDVEENPKVNPIFNDNYTLQIAITLNPENCDIVRAKDAMIASAGQYKMVNFTKLPGEKARYELLLDVDNFEMDGIQITGIPFSMRINISDFGELKADLTKLQEALNKIDDGALELKSGTRELKEGSKSFTHGLKDMQAGMSELQGGFTGLIDNNFHLQKSSEEILKALNLISESTSSNSPGEEDWEKLMVGSSEFLAGLKQLSGGLSDLQKGFVQSDEAIQAQTGGAYTSLNEANEAAIAIIEQQIGILAMDPHANAAQIEQLTMIASLLRANNELTSGVRKGLNGDNTPNNPGLAAVATMLAANYEKTDQALGDIQKLLGAINQLAKNYAAFHSGLVQYLEGTLALYNGYGKLNSGLGELALGGGEIDSGLSLLYNGVRDFQAGTSKLRLETSDLDSRITNELEEMIAKYSGDFQPTSFISEKNCNVKLVQFVMVTDSIKIEKEESPVPVHAKTGFWQRLLALFKKD